MVLKYFPIVNRVVNWVEQVRNSLVWSEELYTGRAFSLAELELV